MGLNITGKEVLFKTFRRYSGIKYFIFRDTFNASSTNSSNISMGVILSTINIVSRLNCLYPPVYSKPIPVLGDNLFPSLYYFNFSQCIKFFQEIHPFSVITFFWLEELGLSFIK